MISFKKFFKLKLFVFLEAVKKILDDTLIFEILHHLQELVEHLS